MVGPMVRPRRPSSSACTYCGARVDSEQALRRHLYREHDPAELGPIDRRRAERYRARPNAVVRRASGLTASLDELRAPVDRATVERYALYGFLASVFVAVWLGVGL